MDWYYTGGLQFKLYHNSLQKSPFDKLLAPFKIRPGERAWYGLALRQELYTPRDLEDDTISLIDLENFAPEKALTIQLDHADGSS